MLLLCFIRILDIDECVRVHHECNHNCTNTEGSYNCYCRSGYELQGNFSCRGKTYFEDKIAIIAHKNVMST